MVSNSEDGAARDIKKDSTYVLKKELSFFHYRRKGENVNIRLILVIILVSFVVVFIVQNVAAVEVSFLFWSISMSRSLLIFFTLIIGLIIGWFLHGYLSYRKAKNELADDV